MGKTVSYEVRGRIAELTLDRPQRYNAIDDEMPGDLRNAVEKADADDAVRVIMLTGAGEAFCAGYDLKRYAERPRPTEGSQEMPWDPMQDYKLMKSNTEDFMSLWRSSTPVICKVNGPAVAGGSDIALAADMIVMAEEAKIGYPPARVWGCPTTMMWVYHLGPQGAKRMLFTGDLINGKEAAEMDLVWEAVPGEKLDDRVNALAKRIAGVPANQLMMQKMAINQAYENMGIETTQMFATMFDGMTRHTPEGIAFKERCEEVGFKQAVAERDSGTLYE